MVPCTWQWPPVVVRPAALLTLLLLLLHPKRRGERGFVVITVRLLAREALVRRREQGERVGASETGGCNDDDHTFAISFAQIPYS